MDMLKETEEGVRNLQGNTALGSANGCRSIGSFLKRICDKVLSTPQKWMVNSLEALCPKGRNKAGKIV